MLQLSYLFDNDFAFIFFVIRTFGGQQLYYLNVRMGSTGNFPAGRALTARLVLRNAVYRLRNQERQGHFTHMGRPGKKACLRKSAFFKASLKERYCAVMTDQRPHICSIELI